MTAVPIDHNAPWHTREPLWRRTGSKVRRDSQAAGGERWQPFSWHMGRRLLLGLRIHAEKQRRKGERTGARPSGPGDKGGISFGAIRLAEILVSIASKHGGRLDPSAEKLAQLMNVPVKSIHAWKAQLERHGFLRWRRRWVETGRQGLRGPQVRQTSNAYVLSLPSSVAEAVDKILKKHRPPPPKEPSPGLAAALSKLEASVTRRTEAGPAFGRLPPT